MAAGSCSCTASRSGEITAPRSTPTGCRTKQLFGLYGRGWWVPAAAWWELTCARLVAAYETSQGRDRSWLGGADNDGKLISAGGCLLRLATSFDHLVGAQQDPRGKLYADCFGGLEV